MKRLLGVSVLLLGMGAAAVVSMKDLARARTTIPRPAFKGDGQLGLSVVLNRHLAAREPRTTPCDQWDHHQLQRFMSEIAPFRSPELQAVYGPAADRRALALGSIQEFERHWAEMNAIAQSHPDLAQPLRDTHCREAVLWWTHHLSESTRELLRSTHNVPRLPETDQPGCNSSQAAGGPDRARLCAGLEQPNSCDWCHSTQASHDAGKPGTSPPNALNYTNGPDDGNPHGWDRQRRCDQDQMPRCQLCEGVGGMAWGDKNDQIALVPCEVVATPDKVDNATVHWPLYPKAFTASPVNGRPGYSDTLIGWKTDPFCFSFFPQNDSIPPLCYRSQDSTGKWYDSSREATRSDYNVKLTGLFSHFPNISSKIMQIWHWDTFRSAQYLGRERIGVEWIQGAGTGNNSKMWTLDHFIMWSHHAWTDPETGRIVRMWKSFNGLQNYDPEAWTDTVVDPDTVFASPPAECKKGGARIRIHCDDDGNYDGKTVEGAEHIDFLAQTARKLGGRPTLDEIRAHYATYLAS